MSSRNVSYLQFSGSFLFLGVTGAVRDVLAKVEIVEVSESLADVTETALCNVREGAISVAATIFFLASKNGQSMLYNVLQAVFERVQDSYRFCRNLG